MYVRNICILTELPKNRVRRLWPHVQSVVEGQQATLTCVSNYKIEWLHNEVPLDRNNYIIQEDSKLKLLQVRDHDHGIYTCRTINNYNQSKEFSGLLLVYSK